MNIFKEAQKELGKRLCRHTPEWVQVSKSAKQYKCSKCGAGVALPLNKDGKLR
jgi:hypothetical protein